MVKEGGAELPKQEPALDITEETATPDIQENEPQIEEVVILLKPGAPQYEERLRAFLTKRSLEVVDRRETVFDEKTLFDFYPTAEATITRRFPDAKDEVIKEMTDYFSEGPSVALLVRGQNAFEIISRLKKKVRGILKLSRPRDGLHSSDDATETKRDKRAVGFNK